MRWLVSFIAAGLLCFAPGLSPMARAQSPVVVEFFTSQGCSACPPADALFTELAQRPEVIALALHVDYWDYLGWKDTFGSPAHTQRQRDYAKAHKQRSIYTPQMMIQGADPLIGHDAEGIAERIATHGTRPAAVRLDVRRNGPVIEIALAPAGAPVGAADVHVVEFIPSQAETIEAGENAGLNHIYSNIVTNWMTVARWDGDAPVDLRHDGTGSEHVAVIVQAVRFGPVLGAAALP